MDPNISELAAYPGDYQQSLLTGFYFGLDAAGTGLTTIPGLKSAVNLHKILVKKGVKPFTGTFNAKDGDVAFRPRKLSVAKAQRDIQILPSKYLATFMERNRGRGENANNMTIPFAQTTWEEVMREVAHEIVADAVYFGQGAAAFSAYAAGTAYSVGALITYTQNAELRYFRCIVATSAGQNPDTNPEKWEWAGARALTKGFGKIITDEISGGGITTAQVVNTGAITSTDAYTQFTSVWRALPEQIRTQGGVIYTSVNNYQYLMDAYENQITKNFEKIDGITYLSKTDGKCQILPVNWLSGSGRLIGSAKNNLYMGTDETSDMNNIKTMEQMYHVDAGITFMFGVQIADLAAMVVNDQA